MKTTFEFRLKRITIARLHDHRIAWAFRKWLDENGFYKVRLLKYGR